MSPKITSFLFDLGNVIVDIAPNKTLDAIHSLLRPEKKDILNVFMGEALTGGYASEQLNDYQIGKISTNQFINFIKNYCHPEISETMIVDAWTSMIIGIQNDVMDVLKHIIAKGLNFYVLSNINELHVNWLKQNAPILNLATACFYSNEIHMAKPDKKCYEYVLAHSTIIPQQTLYLDDLPQNIKAGQQFNFQTWLVEDKSWIDKINSLLNQLEN